MLALGSLASLALFASSTFALVKPHDSTRHHVSKRGEARARNFTNRDDGGTTSGTATWFPDGLGACGTVNVPSDFIVAQNTPQYGNGENCYKSVIITAANGVSQTAVITDECPPPCQYGDMDMSTGLFQAFGYTLDDGVFPITWVYADAAPANDPATSSTPDWTPPPSSTWEPPSTSSDPPPSTSSVPTTTSDFSTTSAASSSSNASAATATATTSTAPTDTAPQTGGNLHAQSKLLVQMANIIAAGGSS